MNPNYVATRHSICPECDGDINIGQSIVFTGASEWADMWAHTRCPNDRPIQVCDRCFIAPCDCE